MSVTILRVLRGGKSRDIVKPSFRRGGAWREASKVYRKEAGAWVEWWPLKPDPPINVTSFFIHRNQRMELDISWDEPGGLLPTPEKYIVAIDVEAGTRPPNPRGAINYRNEVTGTFLNPDEAWDYRNSGNVYISVSSVSFNGSVSDPVTLGPLTITAPPQPPPPIRRVSSQVTGYSVRKYSIGQNGQGAIVTAELSDDFVLRDTSLGYVAGVGLLDPRTRAGLIRTPAGGYGFNSSPRNVRTSSDGANPYFDIDLGRVNTSRRGGVLGIVIREEERTPPFSINGPARVDRVSGASRATRNPGSLQPATRNPLPVRSSNASGASTPSSAWVPLYTNVTQTVTYVQPPTPIFQPPPGTLIPGEARILGQQFTNGLLECDFEVPFSTIAKVWWQEYGKDPVALPDEVPAGAFYRGSVTVADSANWPRDGKTRYRIIVQGGTDVGFEGEIANGPWAIKLPSPYYLQPTGSAELQDGVRDTSHTGEFIRYGTSAQSGVQWTGLLFYDQNELTEQRIGYNINVTAAQVLVQRHPSSTPNYGVPPLLRTHGYDTPAQASTNLSAGTVGRWTSQTPGQFKLQPLNADAADKIVNSNEASFNGLAVRDGLSSSEVFQAFHGPNHDISGNKAWTIRIDHDG